MVPKVAFVATVYAHLAAFHIPFMKLMQEKGIEVHAYASPDQGKEKVQEAGIICHDVSFRRNPFRLKNIQALWAITKSFKKEKFQMVHIHTPVAGFLARLAARAARIQAVIYSAHGFHFFKGGPLLYWLIYYSAERLAARWTHYLITTNLEDHHCVRNFPVKKEVIYIRGVGLDTSKFNLSNEAVTRQRMRSELGLKDGELAVLCVAELNRNKNQIQLIQAVRVMVEGGIAVKVFLVGSGEEEQTLQNYVAKQGLALQIRFLGSRNDIPQLMAAADVFTLLSQREGLSKALMEAMAAGKAIVATDVRGNRDLILDGRNGFLVPVSDFNATANVFMKLAWEPDLRVTMGRQNKEIIMDYDIKRILMDLEIVYDKALSLALKEACRYKLI